MADNLFTLSPSASQAFAAYNCGVYRIVNTKTGKSYVGSSLRISKRVTEHFGMLRRKEHNRYFQHAWNEETDKSVFKTQILIICEEKDLEFYEMCCFKIFDQSYNVHKISTRGEMPEDFSKRVVESKHLFYSSEAGKKWKINNRGSNSSRAKISEEVAQSILDSDGKHVDVALRFGVTVKIVEDIRNRYSWKHLTKKAS